jgi:hypothetical protein
LLIQGKTGRRCAPTRTPPRRPPRPYRAGGARHAGAPDPGSRVWPRASPLRFEATEASETGRCTWTLAQLPESLRERLPQDYRTFLTVARLPNEWDSKPVNELHEALDSPLVFADFLIDSHTYGLWLSGAHEGTVCLLYGVETDPQPPTGTFATFLAAYLADDSVLY